MCVVEQMELDLSPIEDSEIEGLSKSRIDCCGDSLLKQRMCSWISMLT